MISRARSLVPATYVLLTASALLLGGCLDRKLKALNPCLVSGVVAEIAVTNIDKVDMLFMVDDSDSMGDKQTALRAQFPHLITVMTTGDKDGDGKNDFPPAKDMHLGVVTSDMGLPGVDGIQNCQGLGKDGILQNHPSAGGMGCQPSYPPFLTFKAGTNMPAQTATDFACIAVVGTGGCGFEHQLEAPLKALWPSVDPMAAANGGQNRITFLVDPATMKGKLGHGDVENISFVRNDPVMGLSLVAIIVLTDEDDCSASDTGPFTPPQFLNPGDPLAMEGMNLRCHFNQQSLYPVERYVNGFKALRPGNENLVIYAAITGVPVDLVSPDVIAKVDFANATQRDSFYNTILNDPRMKEVVDNMGTPDPSDDKLIHSCVSNVGKADPPIRVVQVAQKFGENGIVQSICQDDYGPALDAIIAIIAKQLGAVCLPRSLVRNSSGLVGCNVVWELPAAGQAPTSTPVVCGAPGFDFLLPPEAGSAAATDRGGAICRVAQLAVKDDPMATGMLAPVATLTDGKMYGEGWYYDNFSDDVKKSCTGASKQRVAFTNNAKPPTGVTVKLECLNETQSLANNRTDLLPSIQQPSIGSPCEKVVINGNPKTGDDACVVQLSKMTAKWPDGFDKSMFCHPKLNVCVEACATDADCPAAWVCDGRPQTLTATATAAHTNGRKLCVNPTCGDVK